MCNDLLNDPLETLYEPDKKFIEHIEKTAAKFQQWPQWKKDMVGYKEAHDVRPTTPDDKP